MTAPKETLIAPGEVDMEAMKHIAEAAEAAGGDPNVNSKNFTPPNPVSPASQDKEFDLSSLSPKEKRFSEVTLPDLKITEEDKTNFFELFMAGERYTETFERLNGKMIVKFQTRMAHETLAITKQIKQDFKDKVIETGADYIDAMNSYRLLHQVVEINGEHVLNETTGSLREAFQKSIYASMPEFKLFVLYGLLHQFENKVLTMSRMAFNPDFT